MKTKEQKIKKVLLLGSGALKIGEAGEFDYSGSQAIKALKEEGKEVILVNPNIATIQTSKGLADRVYFLPVTGEFVERVIKTERPDGIMLGFGGQTALNCGIDLFKRKILRKWGVKVLGTGVETIIETEDRDLFCRKLESLGLKVPKSIAVTTEEMGMQAIKTIGFPAILRVGFALGGVGSAIVRSKNEFRQALKKALSSSRQVLIEKSVAGWKEIEYEVVRDSGDNCVTVCNMENLDPMGVHTGDSVVVAPSQTLTNSEYFKLREIAIKAIRGLKIVGECNIQFALSPKTFDYRIIEVNARLSRSSALASKATGYPLAFVAAKIALGKKLSEIKNSVTGVTCAFFEPALDYVVVKIPRWDLDKFEYVYEEIGTEMKSVGEVMAIGRSFEEAIQKAQRSLDLGFEGVIPENNINNMSKSELLAMIKVPRVGRINVISMALFKGATVEEICELTSIDPWFVQRFKAIVIFYQKMRKLKLTCGVLTEAKKMGFSDSQIGKVFKKSWKNIRALRKRWGIVPMVKRIDTLAGEFPSNTNYLYMTYQGTQNDIAGVGNKGVCVLGSGAYRIGSSVEFDWCAVTTVSRLRKLGYQTIVVNCNPETVSTDYDISDRLYFEELSLERILDIYEIEKFKGVVLSVGGQVPNNLAMKLSAKGVPIMGTSTKSIDTAEDRNKFSRLLDRLKVPQPSWQAVSSEKAAVAFARKVGFPLLLRPSYVLSGTLMRIVYSQTDLATILKKWTLDREHPLVISQFIENADELEIDAVSASGKVKALVVLKHLEEAGIHSGDATVICAPEVAPAAIAARMEEIIRQIAFKLSINGPFNIQFLVKHGVVLVIECNLRASRSFPFSSKTTGVNLIELATDAIVGRDVENKGRLEPKTVAIKKAQFSFNRLRGADPIIRVEMASTGEVACFGRDFEDAYLKAILSVGLRIPKKSILLTVGNAYKADYVESAKLLSELGYKLYATEGTATYLKTFGIATKVVKKAYEKGSSNTIKLIAARKVDMVINIRDREGIDRDFETVSKERSDGYRIRRAAADYNIPLLTNIRTSRMFIQSIARRKMSDLNIDSWEKWVK